MKKTTVKLTLLSLITAGIISAPVLLRADDSSTNATASATAPDATAPAAPAKHKKHNGLPFHGTLDGADTNAMTLTVGSRTFAVTSKTKITKDGQPAVLADGVIGQPISGYYKTDTDGTTLDAVTIHFGAKMKKSDSSETSTNAPAASGN